MTMSNEPQNELSQYERLQIDTSMKLNNLKVNWFWCAKYKSSSKQSRATGMLDVIAIIPFQWCYY